MKKNIILLLLVFLITGCNVKVDLTIDNDLKIKEEISMGGTDELFNTYYKTTPSTIVDNLFLSWNGKEILSENNYLYRKEISDTFNGIIAEKDYISLDEYTKSSIFYNQMYENISYEENDNLVTFKIEGLMPKGEQIVGRYDINSLTLNITVPYKVIDSNANKVNRKSNIYTWYVRDYEGNENISITFDKSIIHQNKSYRVLIITFVSVIITTLIIITLYKFPTMNKQKYRKK